MQLVNLNNSYFLKQNDTATQIKLGVLDYEGNPFPLDTAKKIEVVIGVEEGRVLVKEASLLPGVGEIEFGLDEGDIVPAGDNRLEVHIYTSKGEKHIVPSKGYYKLRVQKPIDDLDVKVTTYTLDYFLDQVNKITEGLPETVKEAQNLVKKMQTDLDEVAKLKEDAKESATLSHEARDVANQIIDDMTTVKADAEKATSDANSAAKNATSAANNANTSADNANLAADRANSEANYAKTQGDYAKTQGDYAKEQANHAKAQGDYAKEQGDYAKTQGDYSKEQGDYAKTQGDYAKTHGDYAKEQGDYAKTQGNHAKTQANHAKEQGDYSKTQGDYAKEQGDYAKAQAKLIDDILDHGSVVAVNGKTGNVKLTAEDVNAIPISEKGVAGGVARLNEDGKVVDANGNEVEGKVKSVNGMIGDVVGLETVEGATQKTNQAEVNAKAYTDQQIQLVTETSATKNELTQLQNDLNNAKDLLDTKANNEDLMQLQQDFMSHSAEKIHQGEVHGLRLIDDNLAYFDGQGWRKVKSEPRIYGVRIDKNNSNPETRVTYIGASVGFTPMRGNDGNFSWGSWKKVFESFEIRPCLLKNKQVQYYLDPNDFTKKIDGSPANLTGDDGDVMIEFGKTLWWKWTDEGDTYTIEISDIGFDGAVKHAFEIEEGYNLVPYYALLLTQILFVIFFKSTNSQNALGRGLVGKATTFASTGGTNVKGMFYGSTRDEQMKFLGIEDYWGNKNWWIDGLVTDSNLNLLIGKGNFNDSGSGYQSFSSGDSSETSGFISSVQGGNEKGFIIKTGGGSTNTYYADYGTLFYDQVARFGGDTLMLSNVGFAYLRLSSSNAYLNANIGARLFCASNGKIYIGAYLGTSVDGKLRSISGTSEPTGDKTIGTFRTEARANN